MTPPRSFYRQPKFWAAACVILAFALWLNGQGAWYEQSQKDLAAASAPKPVGPEKGVVALAWVDRGRVDRGGHVRLWVLFDNRSDSAALDLRFLSFETPGFQPIGGCWRAGGPACRPQGAGARPLAGLPQRLEKGEGVTVFADLADCGERGQLAASGVFTWRGEHEPTERESAVVLPAIPVASRLDRLWFVLGRSVLLLKDLLVPAGLAYLGWYLQNEGKRREREEGIAKESQRRKEEEEKHQREQEEKAAEGDRKREEARQEALRRERESELARVRETWNLMLPKVHRNAEKHYAPTGAAIQSLLDAARAIRQDSAVEEWQLLLWRLLLFLRRMHHMALSIGGFYFRSLEGEERAVDCWELFLRRTLEQLGIEDQGRAVTAISLNETFATFRERLGKSGETPPAKDGGDEIASTLTRLTTRLREWVGKGEFQRALPLLELLVVILLYEMNRPYELWYERRVTFQKKEFWIGLERLESELETLQGRLLTYLNSVQEPEGVKA